jgi:hypothetical protein
MKTGIFYRTRLDTIYSRLRRPRRHFSFHLFFYLCFHSFFVLFFVWFVCFFVSFFGLFFGLFFILIIPPALSSCPAPLSVLLPRPRFVHRSFSFLLRRLFKRVFHVSEKIAPSKKFSFRMLPSATFNVFSCHANQNLI